MFLKFWSISEDNLNLKTTTKIQGFDISTAQYPESREKEDKVEKHHVI